MYSDEENGVMLAWRHLTTANQRIKLAKRVLSLYGGEVDLRINIYRGQVDGTADRNIFNTADKVPESRR